jgi:hypothetical protein
MAERLWLHYIWLLAAELGVVLVYTVRSPNVLEIFTDPS